MAALFSVSLSPSHAAPVAIPLTNASFDVQAIAEGASSNQITGWVVTSSAGVFDPGTTATANSGENVAFTNVGALVHQDTGHDLQADMTYRLKIWVGRQQANSIGSWRLQMVTSTDNLTGFTDYAQLYDGGQVNTYNVSSEVTGVDSGEVNAGELYQVTLTWNTAALTPGVGDRLFIRFFKESGQAGQTLWDTAELTMEPRVISEHQIASASGNLELKLTDAGVIKKVGLGTGGTIQLEKTSSGRFLLSGATETSMTQEDLAGGGLKFIRLMTHPQGGQVTVTETFSKGKDDDSIAWDLEIQGSGAAWTTSMQHLLQLQVASNDLKFWSAWTRTDLPLFNGYRNPLSPMNFQTLHLKYGGGGVAASENTGCSVPIATWLDSQNDVALSLIQAPDDFTQDMTLHSDAAGTVNFDRTKLRISDANTVKMHMQLVAHPADWRAGLGFMTKHWPEAFDPPNPEAHNVGGGGTYADYRGEDITPANVEKYKNMGFTMNWSAAFPWPYIGMSLPPVQSDTETWMSIGGTEASGHVIVARPESVQSLNSHAQKFRSYGFHHLEYFTVTEAGNFVASSAPARQEQDDADLWKNANDFIYYQIPNANMGISSWLQSRVTDSGDPAWQASILRQAKDMAGKLTSCSGICIDRLDHLARFHSGGDDGVTWTGAPSRSLIWSWHDTMGKLMPIMTNANKVVFVNSHIMRRVDVLRRSDGFYSEQRHTGIHNLLAFAGVRKPVVIWDSPQNDAQFQESLYLGIYPTVPFPKANHTTLPNAALEQKFLDYGAMFNAMRGKKWVLQPHVVKVTGNNALANVFEVKGGFVVPIMFGGSANSATVELNNLPIETLHSVEVLQPGVATPVALTATQNGDIITLTDVPLVRGCAMVKITADKSSASVGAGANSSVVAAATIKPISSGHLLQWGGSEKQTYFIQTSSDLLNWDFLPVIKTGANASLQYALADQQGAQRLFVRVMSTQLLADNAYTADFDADGITNWEEIRPGGTQSDPFVAN